MKKTLLMVTFAVISTATFAQNGSGFGLKAGLNYNKNGNLTQVIGDAANDIITGADGKVGYHVGFWGKIDLPKLYIRPEVVYTKTKSSYEVGTSTNDYDISKLDVPVLLGLKIIGPLHVFAGPAFQYILKNDLKDIELADVESDFTVGLNVGAGINLGKIGLDVRYERGFSKNEADLINITPPSRIDSRPSQVIFSLSLKL